MTTYEMAESSSDRSSADRTLRWIGDLDHPFYSDERNRYVWYEASAIAFQLMFLGSYFMTGLVLLVIGSSALPYALVLFVPTMIAAVVFQGYLKRHSAEYWPGRNDLVRRRGQIGILGGAILVAGLIRATIDLQSRGGGDGAGATDSFVGGLISGGVAGLIVGPLAGVAFLAYKARQTEE